MTVKLDGFRAAMRAALEGPEKKDVEWTKFGHDFNVKKVDVKRNGDTIEIDGQDGHHISHRLRFRPDDQVFYKCRVKSDGTVENLEVNIKSSLDVIKQWFEIVGKLADILSKDDGKSDSFDTITPAPGTEELIDGEWRGDAEFLIANIIAFAAAREFPNLKNGLPRELDFLVRTDAVNPDIIARFQRRKEELEES